MKKNLLKLITLALALVLLAGLPAARATTFTFSSSDTPAAEETEEAGPAETAETPAEETEEAAPAEAPETPAEETEEAAPAGPAADAEAGADTEETQESEPAEQPAQAPAAETAEGMPTGFAEALETLAPRLEEILSSASKWSKKKAPAALQDFPVLPADYEGIYAWMSGKTASFAERDGAYTVETEEPSFLPLSGQAVAYFTDMSTLQMARTGDAVYSADKAGAAHQAADFWRIDLSAKPWSLKTEDGILWDFSAGISIASAGMRGPAGGTDEIYFETHRTGEINQSIVWYIRSGELTVDIYYGNGNEVCRELTYDIKTGKLVSSDEW